MEYRRLPKGKEMISTIGLGLGGIQSAPTSEIEEVITLAIQNGINFFDLCAGDSKTYRPFGKAIKNVRDKIYFQLHFGAAYQTSGEYKWSRSLEEIKKTLLWELEQLETDYIDFGFIHCIDEEQDLIEIEKNGIIDYLKELKASGVVRHIGFSSHTPSVAHKVIDTGLVDLMMFSINPAYDLEQGDEYGIGTISERSKLFRRCESEMVGITVMKPFHAGQLLDDATSPFKKALTRNQCIQYALDRPGVLSVLPGVRGLDDLKQILEFLKATPEDKDYSIISEFTPEKAIGTCVYCNHCQPCPVGIDIGLVNKYYDLSLAGDKMAHNHYSKLTKNANDCIHCGHCNSRCPFSVDQQNRMNEIAKYFK